MIKIKRTLREKVASLSSGRFYPCPRDYFDLVEKELGEGGISLSFGKPTIYNNNGRGILRLEKNGEELETCLFFTWYRMEQSGNWEMVGYLT